MDQMQWLREDIKALKTDMDAKFLAIDAKIDAKAAVHDEKLDKLNEFKWATKGSNAMLGSFFGAIAGFLTALFSK